MQQNSRKSQVKVFPTYYKEHAMATIQSNYGKVSTSLEVKDQKQLI